MMIFDDFVNILVEIQLFNRILILFLLFSVFVYSFMQFMDLSIEELDFYKVMLRSTFI